MGIAQNGRSIQRVIYVDDDLVEHIILNAYLGDVLVWDGHVSQTIQIARAISTSQAFVPALSADSLVTVGNVALSYSQANVPSITGGVDIISPVAASTSEAFEPVLHADQVWAADLASSTSQAFVPDIRVVFGVTPPTALSSSQAFVPDVHADALVSPSLAMAYSQAYAPQVGSFMFINPPTATSTSQAFVPVVSGGVKVTPPVASSTSQAFTPALHADAMVQPPLATSSSQAYAPEINAGLPVAFDTSVTAWGTLGTVGSVSPSSLSKTINVAQSGSGIVVFVRYQTGWAANVTVDGVAMTDLGEVRPNPYTACSRLFALPGVSAGTHTITYSPAIGAGTAGVYFIGAAFANASTISSSVAVASGNGQASSVTIPGTGSMPVAFLASNTNAAVSATAPVVKRGASISDNAAYSYDMYSMFTSTQSPIAANWFSFQDWVMCGFWLA